MSIGNAALVLFQDEKPVVVSRAFFDDDEIPRQNKRLVHVTLELYDKENFYRFYPQLTAPDAPTIAIIFPGVYISIKAKANIVKRGVGANGGISVIVDAKTAYEFVGLSIVDRLVIATQIRNLGGLNGT